jgi:hypothetical protein
MLQISSKDVNSQHQFLDNAQVHQDEAKSLPDQNSKNSQTNQSIAPATPPSIQVALLQDGYSPVSVIVAISIVIGAIGGLLKILVPVMLRESGKKTK